MGWVKNDDWVMSREWKQRNSKHRHKSKKDYKIVAYESRWLEVWDWMYCEVTYHKTWKKIPAHDIDHIEWRAWDLYNDKYNLIFVDRTVHQNKTKKDIPLWKEIILQKIK